MAEYMDAFNNYANGLLDKQFSWTDILDMVHERTGITLDLPDEILKELGQK